MSVRVTPTVQSGDAADYTHENAKTYRIEGAEYGTFLVLFDAKNERIATYASGCWASAEVLPEPVVNAAAEPDPRASADGSTFDRTYGWMRDAAGATATAEAVLSETSEPYVSVSVSANDADELAKLLRKLIRKHGAKSFGLAAG